MKRYLPPFVIGLLAGLLALWLHLKGIVAEWREARTMYGFSPEASQDFESRLNWIYTNLAGVLGKLYNDAWRSLVDAGWARPADNKDGERG